MNIVFVGTTRFGLRCLEALLRIPACTVVGVVAAPPTFRISYRPEGVRNVLHADLPAFCAGRDLPCLLLSEGAKAGELLGEIRGWKPDAFVVAGWYHMIPRSWRALAPGYGLHASLLPDYSGGAPLVWAMINGETRTGITLFRLGDGVDDGPIVGQAETDILPIDTIATLYERIEELGVRLLETHIPRLADGTASLQPQDERRRRRFPQRSPEDGLIDWSQPAGRIHDFVRAQTHPYPGAFSWIGRRRATVWASRISQSPREPLQPGHFACADGRLFVGTGPGGPIELVSLDVNGEAIGPADFCMRFGSTGRLGAQSLARGARDVGRIGADGR